MLAPYRMWPARALHGAARRGGRGLANGKGRQNGKRAHRGCLGMRRGSPRGVTGWGYSAMTTFYGQPTAATELIVREVLQGGETEGWGLKSVE